MVVVGDIAIDGDNAIMPVATYHEFQYLIAELEAALWVALDGREVVIRDDTPNNLEWKTTEDGGRLVRRARR